MSTIKFDRSALIHQLDMAVRDAGNVNILLVSAIAQQIGMSATEFECLSVLQDEGPMTAGELARRCGISSGGLTGLVDRLEKMGFAKREPDAHDRRRVLVSITWVPGALQKVEALYAPLSAVFEKVTASMTDDQLQTILTFHQTMNVAMNQMMANMGRSTDVTTT